MTTSTSIVFASTAVLLAAALSHAQPARAQESMSQATVREGDMTDAQARGHFILGRQAYEAGRFADAAQEFEIAYGLSERPQLLYNVYLAYRDAQDVANAARSLRAYLELVPDAPDHEHLAARLTALEATVTAEQVEAARRQAETEEAARRLQEAQEATEQARRRQPTRPLWPYAVVAIGGALVVAGLILDGVAGGNAAALRADCVGNACNPSVNLATRRSEVQSFALAGDVLWITGSLGAIAGLILAFTLDDDQPPPLEVRQVPAARLDCGVGGCELEVQF